MRIRRILFVLLLLAFVALSVWWCAYFPFDQARVYRAIPPNATFVSRHEQLGVRWKEAVRHPLIRAMWQLAGGAAPDLDRLASDRDMDGFMRMAGEKCSVFAYAPAFGDTSRPAWVMSSWIGTYGNLMRWGLLKGSLSGFTRVTCPDGTKVWTVPCRDTGFGSHLSLAAAEGVLVCCLSDDPRGAWTLAKRVRGGSAMVPELSAAATAQAGPAAPDEAWIRLASVVSRRVLLSPLHVGLSRVDKTCTAGWVRGEVAGASAAALADTLSLTNIPMTMPSAFVLLPFGTLQSLLQGPGTPVGLRQAAARLQRETDPSAPVFACLLGGDHSGRILGIKAPTLVIGVKVKNPAAAASVVGDVLDALNFRYGWALIPHQPENSAAATVIDSTGNGVYSSLKTTERPAVAVGGDWLVLCSNLATLEKTLREDPKGVLSGLLEGGAAAPGTRDAVAFAWIDMEPANQALQNAIAVYSLSLLAQGSDGSAETREGLARASQFLDAMRPLGTGTLRFHPRGAELEMEFRFSARDGATKMP